MWVPGRRGASSAMDDSRRTAQIRASFSIAGRNGSSEEGGGSPPAHVSRRRPAGRRRHSVVQCNFHCSCRRPCVQLFRGVIQSMHCRQEMAGSHPARRPAAETRARGSRHVPRPKLERSVVGTAGDTQICPMCHTLPYTLVGCWQQLPNWGAGRLVAAQASPARPRCRSLSTTSSALVAPAPHSALRSPRLLNSVRNCRRPRGRQNASTAQARVPQTHMVSRLGTWRHALARGTAADVLSAVGSSGSRWLPGGAQGAGAAAAAAAATCGVREFGGIPSRSDLDLVEHLEVRCRAVQLGCRGRASSDLLCSKR